MITASSKAGELANLHDMLLQEQRRIDALIARVESALKNTPSTGRHRKRLGETSKVVSTPRLSPLDKDVRVTRATADLRVDSGNLSAVHIAKVYGISLSQLAKWLGRSRQSLSKTPDAGSLQKDLGYFDRIARLRAVTKGDGEFRKWLRTPNPAVAAGNPLELIALGQWQSLADYVDDMLTGTPG